MSLRYTRDDARRRILATFSDPLVEPAEMYVVCDHQVAEGTWSYGVLVDLRNLTQPPTPDGVRGLVEHVRRLGRTYGRRGPVATVSVKLSTYGMARMHEILAEDAEQDVAAFRSVPQAEEWLSTRQRLRLVPRP
jgi:hypothetical protein